MVGMIRGVAPECIDACQGSCGALGNALTAYLQKGGQPAATKAVCASQSSFSCFLKPTTFAKCSSLVKKAAGFGFKLPSSQSELDAQCQNSLLEESDAAKVDESAEDAVVATEETTLTGCTDGMVGMIRGVAPECIDACQGSCGALGNALTAYLQKGGQPAATKAVCASQSSFSCFLKPTTFAKCSSLVKKAAGFGFKLPSSQSELDAQCNSGVR